MQNLLDLTGSAPLSLPGLAINMLLAIVLAGLAAWFYTVYGKSFSNRGKLAATLPILAMITVLIISVVKSSLALSLGLVGALSIVRFRTAIKEPEELIYLFMAIAIGVGLGADQRLATILAVIIMLVYLLVRHFMRPRPHKSNLFLNVSTSNKDNASRQINSLLKQHVEKADLRRLDHNEAGLQATYLIKLDNEESLNALVDGLQNEIPDCEVSFIEQDSSLSG